MLALANFDHNSNVDLLAEIIYLFFSSVKSSESNPDDDDKDPPLSPRAPSTPRAFICVSVWRAFAKHTRHLPRTRKQEGAIKEEKKRGEKKGGGRLGERGGRRLF